MPQLSPLWLLKYLPNMPASHVAIYNDLRGPNNSITHREAAANLAIGEAYRTILRGSADTMLVGATGTRVHPMKTVHAIQTEELAGNGVEPSKASRPFDKNRTGMVIGEGAGAIVIEELATAKARGATIYGEIVGHGSSHAADTNGVAHRDVALANVMRKSLQGAGLEPERNRPHPRPRPKQPRLRRRRIESHPRSVRRRRRQSARHRRQKLFRQPRRRQRHDRTDRQRIGAVATTSSSRFSTTKRPIRNVPSPSSSQPTAAPLPGNCFLNLSVTPQGQASAVLVRTFS